MPLDILQYIYAQYDRYNIEQSDLSISQNTTAKFSRLSDSTGGTNFSVRVTEQMYLHDMVGYVNSWSASAPQQGTSYDPTALVCCLSIGADL
jgi:hypothetical protein